jgi:hypothetical protein
VQGVLLALDQVLRKYWSCLTTFGTFLGWLKMECPGGVEIMGSHLFCRLVDPAKGLLGLCNGLWDVGPWVYPCLGLVVKVYIGRNVM